MSGNIFNWFSCDRYFKLIAPVVLIILCQYNKVTVKWENKLYLRIKEKPDITSLFIYTVCIIHFTIWEKHVLTMLARMSFSSYRWLD